MSYYNVLFICKHNVFRSQVAEAYFNQKNKNSNLRARSGGLFSHPSLNHFQVQIAEELGVFYRDAKSKNLTTQDLAGQDLIVIVANNIASDLIEPNIYPGPIERWDIHDVIKEDKEGVKKVIMEIKLKVDELLGRLNAG